jgi:HSP20 family molecular chaperone IbpA
MVYNGRMQQRKRSFFERLTGTVSVDTDDFIDYDVREETRWDDEPEKKDEWLDRVENNEGELALDMYQTPDEIVIQAMIAGVRPEDIDISITRELVTIKGHREGPRGVDDTDYFHHGPSPGNRS